jgi:hypothetical protein
LRLVEDYVLKAFRCFQGFLRDLRGLKGTFKDFQVQISLNFSFQVLSAASGALSGALSGTRCPFRTNNFPHIPHSGALSGSSRCFQVLSGAFRTTKN